MLALTTLLTTPLSHSLTLVQAESEMQRVAVRVVHFFVHALFVKSYVRVSVCVCVPLCVCVCVNVLKHKFNCKRMERVTRPQEFKTKVATNTKHAIKTTTTATAVTGYQHIDINCRTYPNSTPHSYPFLLPHATAACVAKRMTGNRM